MCGRAKCSGGPALEWVRWTDAWTDAWTGKCSSDLVQGYSPLRTTRSSLLSIHPPALVGFFAGNFENPEISRESIKSFGTYWQPNAFRCLKLNPPPGRWGWIVAGHQRVSRPSSVVSSSAASRVTPSRHSLHHKARSRHGEGDGPFWMDEAEAPWGSRSRLRFSDENAFLPEPRSHRDIWFGPLFRR